MSINEDWAYTEQCLQPAAESMGHLLARMRPHLATAILDGTPLWQLLDRASEIPVTMAAFPFGIEVPMHDPAPRADFGVSLTGASLTARHYQEQGHAQGAGPSSAGLAWLLDETDRETSLLRHVAGRKMGLEFDIDVAENGAYPDPGIFLYPVGDVLEGGAGRLKELRAVHDALVFAAGWDADAAERRQHERLYESLPAGRRIRGVGTFPSRKRVMRTTATGFRKAEEVVAYLQRNDWPGDVSAVGDLVGFFAGRKTFAYLGLHLDVTAAGVGPALGLSFYVQETQWLKDIKYWIPVLDAIGEQGVAVPGKLEELARWAGKSATLFTKSGPMMFVRGIHHIKLSITGGQVDAVKGYIFFLIMARRPK